MSYRIETTAKFDREFKKLDRYVIILFVIISNYLHITI